jgi:hypothetical protein
MNPGQNPNFSGYCIGKYCTGNIESGAVLYSRRGDIGWTQVSERTMPKYRKGDYLYVRETWASDPAGFCIHKVGYREPITGLDGVDYLGKEIRWRPSIHMEKETARIFLRVTDVRVERLQDITEKQAVKEGASKIGGVLNFKMIWESTLKNKDKHKYGWNANPFVWAYEFERVIPD